MEQYFTLKMGSAQKANETENAPGVTFVPGKAKLTKSHLKSKKKTKAIPFVYNKGNRGRTGSSTRRLRLHYV